MSFLKKQIEQFNSCIDMKTTIQRPTYFLVFLLLGMIGLAAQCTTTQEAARGEDKTAITTNVEASNKEEIATFAGGCFWCTEAAFEQIKGVNRVVSGYSGGAEKNPTYGQVSSGATTHAEAINIYYNPNAISYQTLLDIFFVAHDPTTLNRQGPDVGTMYRSAIYYRTDAELKAIESTIAALNESTFNNKITTEVKPLDIFYPAEDYHQDYVKYNPNNSYVKNVSLSKIKKVAKTFPDLLK